MKLHPMQATGVSCKGINQHCPRSHYSFFIEGTTRTSISLERNSEQTPLPLSHIKQYVAKCRLTKAQSQGQILQNESNGCAGDDMMPPSCTSTFRSTCPSWSAIRSLSSWGTGQVVGSLFCRCFPKIGIQINSDQQPLDIEIDSTDVAGWMRLEKLSKQPPLNPRN